MNGRASYLDRRAAALLLVAGCVVSCGGGSDGAKPQAVGGNAATTAGTSSDGSTSTSAAGSSSQSGSTNQDGNPSQSGAQNGGASQAGSTSQAGGTSQAGQSAGGASGAIDCRATGDGKSTITLISHCTGTLSFRGSGIDGGDLKPGEHACRDVGTDKQSIPALRFWGFIGEDPGPERYTLAELTLNTTFNDFDWFNISHVDASNLPMQVAAVDMPKCRVLTCAKSLLADCPAVGQEKDASGTVISCFNPTRDDKNSVVAQYYDVVFCR